MKIPAILIHILLWLAYFLIMVYSMPQAMDLNYSLVLASRNILLHALIFYINTEILIPKLLIQRKYLIYVLSVLGLTLIAILFVKLSYDLPFIREAYESVRPDRPPRRFPGPRNMISRKMIYNLVSFLAILFISTVYSLINISRKKEEQEITRKNEALDSELKFLKNQISPHFLFNALNNIYALSFTGSAKAPEMILKLSNMLRYVLYECNVPKVPLKLELDYLLNYIELQKIKEEAEPDIKFEHSGINEQLKLEPLLLIPFIENSFKHSKIEDSNHGWISIELKTEDKKIFFSVKNSPPVTSYKKDPVGGIGLKNVRRRLELVYPDRHQLVVQENQNEFSIQLILDTHED